MSTATSLSVVVLVYKELDFIPGLCASLQKQTMQPVELVFVDNSSDSLISGLICTHAPHATIIRTGKNVDFSRGVNLGIQSTTTDYVLLLNPDMALEADMTEKLLACITADERIGALAPKLRRLEKTNNTPIIDSMGIVSNRSRRFWNRGEGEQDVGQYDDRETFGIAGTAILFRRAALNDIAKYGGGASEEFFDEDFVAYKDDVDLSYRLRHRGWKICIEPTAIAYHQRTAREENDRGLRFARQKKSLRIRGNSFRNHWFCLLKNEPAVNLFLLFPWIFWYEFRKFLYVLFCETSTLTILLSTIRLLPRMLHKRRAILESSKMSPSELRSWFNTTL